MPFSTDLNGFRQYNNYISTDLIQIDIMGLTIIKQWKLTDFCIFLNFYI